MKVKIGSPSWKINTLMSPNILTTHGRYAVGPFHAGKRPLKLIRSWTLQDLWWSPVVSAGKTFSTDPLSLLSKIWSCCQLMPIHCCCWLVEAILHQRCCEPCLAVEVCPLSKSIRSLHGPFLLHPIQRVFTCHLLYYRLQNTLLWHNSTILSSVWSYL